MKITNIENPKFLKSLSLKDTQKVVDDLRRHLINQLLEVGGHFSSNLCVVELTVMLHKLFNFQKDKIFFDIGHQTYCHKILTGRVKNFQNLRKYRGLSGFQKINENEYDHWEAGHAGTSLSAAIGYAKTVQNQHIEPYVVVFVGDASLTNGMFLEALNYLGYVKNLKIIIILNDNKMSIGENKNFLNYSLEKTNYLANKVRIDPIYNLLNDRALKIFHKIPIINKTQKWYYESLQIIKENASFSNFFKFFHLDYLGPFDGHNITEINNALIKAKKLNTSLIIHFKTLKGKGHLQAEADKIGKYHSISPNQKTINKNKISWSKAVSLIVEDEIKKNKNIYAITPAMIKGSELQSIKANIPENLIDVGIAEEHAVTMAAGLALNKYKPILFIYSTFLQRAYDQLNHDINGLNLPLVLCIDRCGLATGDGRTHHGLFDINLLHNLSNAIIVTPNNQEQLKWSIHQALNKNKNNIWAIRISKRKFSEKFTFNVNFDFDKFQLGKWIYDEKEIKFKINIMISYGKDLETIVQFLKKHQIIHKFAIIDAWNLLPIDTTLLIKLKKLNKKIFIYEKQYFNSGLAMIIKTHFELKAMESINFIPLVIDFLKNFEQGSDDDLLASTRIGEKNLLHLLLKTI